MDGAWVIWWAAHHQMCQVYRIWKLFNDIYFASVDLTRKAAYLMTIGDEENTAWDEDMKEVVSEDVATLHMALWTYAACHFRIHWLQRAFDTNWLRCRVTNSYPLLINRLNTLEENRPLLESRPWVAVWSLCDSLLRLHWTPSRDRTLLWWGLIFELFDSSKKINTKTKFPTA